MLLQKADSMNFVLAGLVPQSKDDAPAWEKKHLTGTYDNVFATIYQGLDTHIHTTQESGTIPEFEIYDAGMINNIAYFKKQRILKCPIYLQFVLGIQDGLPVWVDNLVFLRNIAKKQLDEFNWSCAAAGRHQFPVITTAMAMGGNARIPPYSVRRSLSWNGFTQLDDGLPSTIRNPRPRAPQETAAALIQAS